ncbi:MAG: PBP1A family penicillin-binding protein [Desulfobacterales bacterium]|nr:PBP1A family penicillin-binding protein [Desulfobacterales bacterium]
MKTKTTLIILIFGVLLGATIGTMVALTQDLPQIRSLETFRPSAVTRIYSADKILLAEFFLEKRDPVSLQVIPDYLVKALISTEDRNFYKHSGVDLKGVLRAIIKDVRAGQFVEGASTITQQLAKTLFLSSKKTMIRKIREAFLAFQLERRYTKDEILQFYLNQVYFGSGAYGVESAARIFFGKSVTALSLSESALIAALPRAPSRYSPHINKPLAVKRRNIVLRQMLQAGIIGQPAYQEAVKEDVHLIEPDRPTQAPYFVQYIKTFLDDTIGPEKLYQGGVRVFTTLSHDLQRVAEKAVQEGLASLESRMKRQGIVHPDPQGALISIDAHSGGILAMVGGKDFTASAFNRTTAARRQAGSAFKPVLYAYAIEHGFKQNTMILDAPVAFKGAGSGKDWAPKNFTNTFEGELSLRKALALSKNIPAVRLMEMLGPLPVARFAHSLGIESTLSVNLSLALGTSETTLMELTSAYAVFADQGKRTQPFGVVEIVDHSGRSIWRIRPQKTTPMSRTGAAIITNMLEGVIKEGTGKKAQVISHPIAGKTGTTDDFKDALFIGFSPSIVTGVWIGRDDHTTLGKGETGAAAALPVWIQFMEAALLKKAYQYFDIPDGVMPLHMNPSSGAIVSGDDPDGVAALFRKDRDNP